MQLAARLAPGVVLVLNQDSRFQQPTPRVRTTNSLIITVLHVGTPGLTSMLTLSNVALATGVLSAAIVALLMRLVLQWRRLSHVPGPLFASLSKGWMVRASLKGRQPISFKEVNDKYGQAPNYLIAALLLMELDA